MRQLLSVFLLLLAAPAWGQVTLAPKPADGPLATAVKGLPDAKAVKEFRATESAKVGKLAPWTYQTRGGKTLNIEMRQAPVADGEELVVFVRVTVDGEIKGIGTKLVEWERVRIHGPPLLAPDGTYREELIEGQTTLIANLKEDPAEALRQDLGHTLSIVTSVLPARLGTIGNTTSTFYPSAGAVEPVDGYAIRSAGNESWSAIHDGAGSSAWPSIASQTGILLQSDITSNQYDAMRRSYWLFDTSAIDTDTISTATLSIRISAKGNTLGETPLHICASSPASTSNLVAADYSAISATSFASIAFSSISTSVYNDFSLNASGIANIDTAGISKFGGRLGWDIDDSPPTWSSNKSGSYTIYYADQTGTSLDPKLVVEHSSGGGPGVMMGAPF